MYGIKSDDQETASETKKNKVVYLALLANTDVCRPCTNRFNVLSLHQDENLNKKQTGFITLHGKINHTPFPH